MLVDGTASRLAPRQRALRDELSVVTARCAPGRLALMIYGSVARGSANSRSDLDVLELVTERPAPYKMGRANITQYLPTHLRQLAERGSLFVMHLLAEGEIVMDAHGVRSRALSAYVPPADYRDVREQISLAGAALDPNASDIGRYLPALVRMGIYLLRTATYVRCIEMGQPTFDVSEAVDVVGQSGLYEAIELRRRAEFTVSDLVGIRGHLAGLLGDLPHNRLPSIEAYAVSVSERQDMAALFGAILGERGSVDYSTLSLPSM